MSSIDVLASTATAELLRHRSPSPEIAVERALETVARGLDARAIACFEGDGSGALRQVGAWGEGEPAMPERLGAGDLRGLGDADGAALVAAGDDAEGPAAALLLRFAPGHAPDPASLTPLAPLAALVVATAGRGRAERQLEESAAVDGAMFASNPSPMLICDQASLRFLRANEAAVRSYGWTEDEFRAMTLRDLLPAEDREAFEQIVAARKPGLRCQGRWRHLRQDGSIRHVSIVSSDLRYDGRAARVATVHDLTEQVLAEEALRESEEKYRRIVETAVEGVWIVDAARKTTFANARMAEMLGYTPGEMLGRSMYDFMDEAARWELEPLAARREAGVSETHDFRLRHRDGREVWVLISANPMLADDGSYVGALGMVTDITERRALEARLAHVQALEAVGRLAGGIAHDFNNLLTIIFGCTAMASGKGGQKLDTALDGIRDATRRGAELTARLLALAHRHPSKPEPVDINALIAGVVPMLERVLGAHVAIDLSLADELSPALADESQLERVLINLAGNARDALPGGGRVSIATRHQDDAVVIEFVDDGEGMSAEVRAHIFEPFFTTKGEGLGTGLGLASSYGIVQQFGGSIECDSAPGQGSTFRVFLRRTEASEPEAPGPQEAEAVAPARKATLLFVEDEPQLRDLWPHILEKAGYAVLVAHDGAHALEVASDCADVDLLVTDVVMPRLNGYAVVDRLRAERPDLKVLYMSGYSPDALPSEALAKPGTDFLPKPFGPADLVQRIRVLLDS